MKSKEYHSIWSFNDVPEKDEFVLISNGPYQDFPETEGRSYNKEELIREGTKKRTKVYSSIRIYNDQKKIVWDAFLPTTLPPNQEEYDPEYFREIISKR